MFGVRVVLFHVFIWTLINLLFVSASKLNVPRVLIPIFKDFTPNFTLEVTENDDSCFKWKTTNPDAIKLTPFDEDPFLKCSRKLIVSSTGQASTKTIAIVIGDDVNSENSLRCDVILDKINTLDVKSKTRELYLNEAPEIFEIRALDSQGNEFSTLEGVEFLWSVEALGKTKNNEALRCMPFSAYDYEAPAWITILEAQNKKGNMAVLDGVNTGAAKVIITLPYAEYRNMVALEVQVSVSANIILLPQEAYIMAGDFIQYKVYIIKFGKMEEIILEGSQYEIEVQHKNIAKVPKMPGEVHAMTTGQTEVYLIDVNLPSKDIYLKPPSALLHVVEPYRMTLAVMPYRNWAVLIGERHELIAEVFTEDDIKLTLGKGVKVQITSTDHFQIKDRTLNGTWVNGWCLKKGVAVIDASLQMVENPTYGTFKLDKPITTRGELLIFPRISISPPEVVLPWDDNLKPKYDIELVAKGGDGKFIWSTTDNTKGIVNQNGRVRTLGSGSFEISAAMMRNHNNRETVKFSILPPAKLEIVEHLMEAEIGYPVHVNIALYASKNRNKDTSDVYIPFTKCQDLPFQLKLSNERFRQNRSDIIDPIGVSCANMALVAFSHGSSKITISYVINGKILEDSATISAYKPIKLEQPEADIVLAVGSSAHLVFTGGPQPSLSQPMEHYRNVSTSNPDIIKVEDATNPHTMLIEDFTVIDVLCLKLGETDLHLKISNNPIIPNCQSIPGSVAVKVYCGKPRSIQMTPEIQVVDVHTCPLDLTAEKVIVQSKTNIELDIIIRDDAGRRFLNISSFLYQWKIDKTGELLTTSVFARPHTFGTVFIPHRSYQVVSPLVETGTIHVNVTLESYNMTILEALGVTPEWPEFVDKSDRLLGALPPITTGLQLVLVEEIILTPNDTFVYNNPSNKQLLDIMHGSGYYQLLLNSDTLAKVTYHEITKQIEVIPMETGELIIQVVDLCLPTTPVTALINIISVGIIRVEMSDKIELGKCIHSTVRLYDEHDNLMMLENVEVVQLKYMQTLEIVSLESLEDNKGEKWPLGEVHYLVTGSEVGKTVLQFSVNNGFLEVYSAPIEVQVFEPLEIYPKNGSLLIGATIQISTRGGPIPHLNLEYSVLPETYATISSKGIMLGIEVGEVEIRVRSTGIHPTTGRRVIYSQDKTTIRVVNLPAIKIGAPLTRFKVGATVPMWITGIPESLSPMVLGAIENSAVQFDWYSEDSLLVEIHHTFEELGIYYRKQDRLSIRLTGLLPGKTRIVLNATLPGITTESDSTFVMFSTFIDVEIFDELQLINPSTHKKSCVLLAPHSWIQLETNFDDMKSVQYRLQGSSVLKDRNGSKEMLSSNNMIGLSKLGKVVSFGPLGASVIEITAKDDQGLKQELQVIVEVKEVHYMMADIKTDWFVEESRNLRFIPLGVQMELQATYYDMIGNKFDAGPSDVKVRTSRSDLVRVKRGSTNSSVFIITKKEGHTVLKLWSDGQYPTAYYLKLHFERCVKPVLTHVTRGDIVCLYSSVRSRGQIPGKWLSSDKTLVSFFNVPVDIAYVTGNKEGSVILTHTLHSEAPWHLQVLPVQEIDLTSDHPDGIITNYDDNQVFRAYVVMNSELSADVKFSNLIHGWDCRNDVDKLMTDFPFTCHIDFSNQSVAFKAVDIFSVKSVFVKEAGQYACEVESLQKNRSEVSLIETHVMLFAMSLDDPDIVSTKLKIPFLPAVYAPGELILPDSGIGKLVITGLPKILNELQVKAADSSLLYIGKGELDDKTISYMVQVLDYHWKLADIEDVLSIFVESVTTNQSFSIKVKVKDSYLAAMTCSTEHSPLFSFVSRYRNALAIIISMMVIFVGTFYVYSCFLMPSVNVNLIQNQSQRGLDRSMSPRNNSIGNYSINTRLHPSNCQCSPCSAQNEPVYGDVSSFYNSSDIRRNRRFM